MSPEQFHARIWEILEPVDEQHFHVVATDAPSQEQVAAVEAAVGFAIPEAFLAFSRKTNGLCVIAREETWPPAKLYSVGPAWTFWRGLVWLGFDAPDLPEWASIANMHQQLVEREVTGVLPLLKVVGDGRVWGVDASGRVVLVNGGEVEPLEIDLTEVYAEQVGELVQRQQDMAARMQSQEDQKNQKNQAVARKKS